MAFQYSELVYLYANEANVVNKLSDVTTYDVQYLKEAWSQFRV